MGGGAERRKTCCKTKCVARNVPRKIASSDGEKYVCVGSYDDEYEKRPVITFLIDRFVIEFTHECLIINGEKK